jgi:type IV secretion system protein VirB9
MPAGLASYGGFPIVQAFNRTGKQIGMNTQIRGHLIVLDSVPHQIKLRLGHEVVDIERGS